MKLLSVRGLPNSIAQDAWWLAQASGGTPAIRLPPQEAYGQPYRPKQDTIWLIAGLAALVILADFLFWDRSIGLSLAVFALILHACLWILTRDEANKRSTAFHVATAILSVLPVIELLQALSLCFLVLGLLINAARVALGQDGLEHGLARAMLRLGILMPLKGAKDLLGSLGKLRQSPAESVTTDFLANWALPTLGAILILILFSIANPVFDVWLQSLFRFELPETLRVILWFVVAACVWPLLIIRRHYAALAAPSNMRFPSRLPGVNSQSIARALVVFNLLMIGQNLLDGSVLLGALPLPEDLSLSQYVRRGAYTLIATAMLAGGFAIMSRPFVGDNRWLTRLLYLWIAQNMVLVLSGATRLNLVIQELGFSHMRLYGGIWMFVVFAGLGLIACQIATHKNNNWLWRWNLIQVGVILFLCCFVNFAHVIAANQVARGNFGPYVCSLGPNAAPALKDVDIRCSYAQADPKGGPIYNNWFDWGFREARIRAYLAAKD